MAEEVEEVAAQCKCGSQKFTILETRVICVECGNAWTFDEVIYPCEIVEHVNGSARPDIPAKSGCACG